jgi:phosphoesterase RecJ-like protein
LETNQNKLDKLQIFDEVLCKIKEYNTIILHRHVRPDGDCIGSQMGLKKFIQTNFPEKTVLTTGDELPLYLKEYGEIDSVPDAIYKDSLVIVVDTSTKDRICDNRYETGAFIIKFDHHDNSEEFGQLSYVDEKSPSCSSILAEMFHYFEEKYQLVVDCACATMLYLGITTDTGRFRYRGVDGNVLIQAGYLVDKGVDIQTLYNHLYIEDLAPLRLQGYVYNHFKTSPNGVVSIFFTRKMMKKFGVTKEEAANLVNSLSNIRNSLIWVAFIDQQKTSDHKKHENNEYLEKEVRVRLRSRFVAINDIAEKYRGGGHLQAAGATVYGKKEQALLLKELDQRLAQFKEENKNVF